MAVTNVFGVIENVIEQLEKEQHQKDQLPGLPLNDQELQGSVTEESNCKEEPLKQVNIDGKDPAVCSTNELPNCNLSSSDDETGTSNKTRSKGGVAFQEGTSFTNSKELNNRTGTPEITGTATEVCDNQLGKRSADRNMNENHDKSIINIGRTWHENCDLKQTQVKENQKMSANIPSGNSVLEKDLVSGSPNQDGDDEVAMEYFEDENVWKFISNNFDSNARFNFDNGPKSCDRDNMQHQGRKREGIFGGELESMSDKVEHNPGTPIEDEMDHVIEPAYVILDDELKSDEIHSFVDGFCKDHIEDAEFLHDSSLFKEDAQKQSRCKSTTGSKNKIQELIIDALELELLRRLGDAGLETFGIEVGEEITRVAFAVAETSELNRLRCYQERTDVEGENDHGCDAGVSCLQENAESEVLHADAIVCAVNHVYNNTTVLARIMPAGVLVGVVLAALSPLKLVISDGVRNNQPLSGVNRKESYTRQDIHCFPGNSDKSSTWTGEIHSRTCNTHDGPLVVPKTGLMRDSSNQVSKVDGSLILGKMGVVRRGDDFDKDMYGKEIGSKEEAYAVNEWMMDAVAAATGATAVLAGQRASITNSSIVEQGDAHRISPDVISVENKSLNEIDDDTEIVDSKTSIVGSFAEKAMSVAAPVVPTKEDGGVDHERLVAILAGLGQKGGILRFIGKVALLWGGLRGAMSLTDRLLGFFRMYDRPLHQRLMGFIVMVLLLWLPVIVPLLPALLRQWASSSASGVASMAAVIGLYGAILILITIWGRKIRGYDMPLSQYGLKLLSALKARQLYSFTSGLAVAFSLVTCFYIMGIYLGFIHFSWATNVGFSASKIIISKLVSCWRIMQLVMQSFGMGLAIAIVEELLFRSWLHEEIAADLGFHKAAVLTGLVFSVSHGSLPAVPGLWLLSLVLAAARVRCNGDLDLAIGLHAGLIAGNRLFIRVGVIKYAANAPNWFTGAQAGNPLAGLLGVSVLGMLALLLYPWHHFWREKNCNQEDVTAVSSRT